MEKKRSHRLTVKNSVGEWKTVGSIIVDADTAAIINPLIAAGKIGIVLNDEVDINSLIRLHVMRDNKTYLNNYLGVFSYDRQTTTNTIVAQKPTVMQEKTVVEKQSAADFPF